MDRRLVFVGGVLAVLGMSACDGTSPVAKDVSASDPLVERIVEMGFRKDMIEDKGSYFLVEGDIALDKAELAALTRTAPAGPSFQWRTDYLVSGPSYIAVDLRKLSSYPDWANATRAAMNHWNSVPGVGVKFTEISHDYTASIIVKTYNSSCGGGSCTLAVASWPSSSGAPGRTIDINVGFNIGYGPGGQPTYASKVYNMVHELGHTISFRHTNWQGRGEPSTSPAAYQIPNTPQTDALSVMNGGTANNDWAGFSYYDRVAARTLYLGPGVPVTGSVSSGYPQLTWSALADVIEYRVYMPVGSFPFESSMLAATTTGTSWTGTFPVSSARVCDMFENGWNVTAVFAEGETTVANKICFS